MRVDDLDIPAGLEESYFKVVQFGSASAQNVILLRRSPPARSRRWTISERSLFVRFQSLWALFDSARRTRWQVYWATLPFGDHGGADGYPGSGYSGFIYVNAPRYASDLALLLDPPDYPPPSTELFTNGSMFSNLNGWSFGPFGDSFFDNHSIRFEDSNIYFLQQNLSILQPGTSYHLKFDVLVTQPSFVPVNPWVLRCVFNETPILSIDLIPYQDNAWHTLDFDFSTSDIPGAELPSVFALSNDGSPANTFYGNFKNWSLKRN